MRCSMIVVFKRRKKTRNNLQRQRRNGDTADGGEKESSLDKKPKHCQYTGHAERRRINFLCLNGSVQAALSVFIFFKFNLTFTKS